MVSAGLALVLCVEIVLCGFICFLVWEVSIAGFPVGMMVLVVVAMVVVIRVGVLLLEFAGAYHWRSPRGPGEHIGPWGTLRLVGLEILSALFVMGVLLPFSNKLIGRRRGPVSLGGHVPVIFIHGYLSRRGIFAPMLDYLWDRGLANTFMMHFQPRHGDMDEFARQLAACVERVCNMTRTDKVILVGFSMGGLVARGYVERFGQADASSAAHRVAKVVTIGTPHHGTGIARVVLGTNGREMRVGSVWLSQLNRDENIPDGTAYVAIYSAHDNLVYPQRSAELGKARNIRLLGKGHLTLILSKEVGNLVYREIVST